MTSTATDAEMAATTAIDAPEDSLAAIALIAITTIGRDVPQADVKDERGASCSLRKPSGSRPRP